MPVADLFTSISFDGIVQSIPGCASLSHVCVLACVNARPRVRARVRESEQQQQQKKDNVCGQIPIWRFFFLLSKILMTWTTLVEEKETEKAGKEDEDQKMGEIEELKQRPPSKLRCPPHFSFSVYLLDGFWCRPRPTGPGPPAARGGRSEKESST